MSLFAVLFRTAILFCLCKTQERPCVNHSGFRIGTVFIFLFTTVRLSIEQIQLVIWRRIVVVVVNVLKGAEKLDFLERVDG